MAGLDLSGMDSLLNRLQEMSDIESKNIIKKALKAGAVPILEDAKNTSAFIDRTGNLRESLKIGTVKTKNGIKHIEIGVSKGDTSKAFYGKFAVLYRNIQCKNWTISVENLCKKSA